MAGEEKLPDENQRGPGTTSCLSRSFSIRARHTAQSGKGRPAWPDGRRQTHTSLTIHFKEIKSEVGAVTRDSSKKEAADGQTARCSWKKLRVLLGALAWKRVRVQDKPVSKKAGRRGGLEARELPRRRKKISSPNSRSHLSGTPKRVLKASRAGLEKQKGKIRRRALFSTASDHERGESLLKRLLRSCLRFTIARGGARRLGANAAEQVESLTSSSAGVYSLPGGSKSSGHATGDTLRAHAGRAWLMAVAAKTISPAT